MDLRKSQFLQPNTLRSLLESIWCFIQIKYINQSPHIHLLLLTTSFSVENSRSTHITGEVSELQRAVATVTSLGENIVFLYRLPLFLLSLPTLSYKHYIYLPVLVHMCVLPKLRQCLPKHFQDLPIALLQIY